MRLLRENTRPCILTGLAVISRRTQVPWFKGRLYVLFYYFIFFIFIIYRIPGPVPHRNAALYIGLRDAVMPQSSQPSGSAWNMGGTEPFESTLNGFVDEQGPMLVRDSETFQRTLTMRDYLRKISLYKKKSAPIFQISTYLINKLWFPSQSFLGPHRNVLSRAQGRGQLWLVGSNGVH